MKKTRGGGTTKYPIVEVKWADHWIDHGDSTMEEVMENLKPYYGEFIGYEIGNNKQMVALAANIWENGEPSEVMYIMKRAIVSRKVLSSE